MSSKKKAWALAIIFIAFLQMHGVGLSAMLAPMALAFPEAGDARIQFVGTLPALVVLITLMPASLLARRIKHRYLTALGSAIASVFALLGFAFHGSVAVLYLWSVVLGIGSGFTIAVGSLIINDLFDGQERLLVLGLQSFATSFGTMLLNFLGGRLLKIEWYYGYLAYLITILPLLASIFLLRNSQEEAAAARKAAGMTAAGQDGSGAAVSSGKGSYAGVAFSLIAAFFSGILSNVLNTNVGLFLAERGITAVTAGTLMSVFLLISGCMGLLVNTISKRIGRYTLSLGFALSAAGSLLIAGGATPMVVAGGVISACMISLVMPTVISNAADSAVKSPEMAITLTLMTANLGNFASPVTTWMSSAMFASDLVVYRYILGFAIAAAVTAASAVFIRRTNRQRV